MVAVKTPAGLIVIGWRKRVINIDWHDTPIRKIITEDPNTKSETMVHAWNNQEALKYLTALAEEINKYIGRATPAAVQVVRHDAVSGRPVVLHHQRRIGGPVSVSLNIGNVNFRIKAANKLPALIALKADKTLTANPVNSSSAPRLLGSGTLEEAIWAFRWEANNDETGNICAILFDGDRYGEEDELFAALAPFVEDGSVIEAEGEGNYFRWRFAGGKLFTDLGKIVYEKDE